MSEHTPMSDERLAEIEAREAKAAERLIDYHHDGSIAGYVDGDGFLDEESVADDTVLVARSVGELLAEVHRLRAAKEPASTPVSGWSDEVPKVPENISVTIGFNLPPKAMEALEKLRQLSGKETLAETLAAYLKLKAKDCGFEFEHQETSDCGFDRNASHAAGKYVCACGWEETGRPITPADTHAASLLDQCEAVLTEVMEYVDFHQYRGSIPKSFDAQKKASALLARLAARKETPGSVGDPPTDLTSRARS